MLRHLALPVEDPAVLVAMDTKDDAAVYRLDDRTALVLTTDFFTPIVDDPFDFGRVAAANALSDVYAMGARPLVALNLVAFPRSLDFGILGRILEGGLAVLKEAGVVLMGGHSIEDPEPKYGMAVVGTVAPDAVMRNVGARPGDQLVLTKPLGTGVVATAVKNGDAREDDVAAIVQVMSHLNRAASEVFVRHREAVHALTDVTGFGLLGHLLEMLEGSGVGATLSAGAVPILDAARRHAAAGAIPGGSRANLEAVADRVGFEGAAAADPLAPILLADAQTSGGLLAAVAPDALETVLAELRAAAPPAVAVIGEVSDDAGRVRVVD